TFLSRLTISKGNAFISVPLFDDFNQLFAGYLILFLLAHIDRLTAIAQYGNRFFFGFGDFNNQQVTLTEVYNLNSNVDRRPAKFRSSLFKQILFFLITSNTHQ